MKNYYAKLALCLLPLTAIASTTSSSSSDSLIASNEGTEVKETSVTFADRAFKTRVGSYLQKQDSNDIEDSSEHFSAFEQRALKTRAGSYLAALNKE